MAARVYSSNQANVTFVIPVVKMAKNSTQFNWLKICEKSGEHAVSLRSIGTYDVKVRLIFALCPRSIGLRGEILYIGMSI